MLPVKTRGHLADVIIIVGRNELAVLEARGAVQVELMKADGEELHDFARVILIWMPASGIVLASALRLFVAAIVEVYPHTRMIGDGLEKFPKITQTVGQKDVVVIAESVRAIRESVSASVGDHQKLAPRVSDTLSELISGGDCLLPPHEYTAMIPISGSENSRVSCRLREKNGKMSLFPAWSTDRQSKPSNLVSVRARFHPLLGQS